MIDSIVGQVVDTRIDKLADLSAWWEKHPDASRAVATRMALRVFPIVQAEISESSEAGQKLILPVSRALTIAWVSVRYPDRASELAPHAAAAVAEASAAEAYRSRTAAAANAAARVADSAAGLAVAPTFALSAARSADEAAKLEGGAATLWQAVTADVQSLELGDPPSAVAAKPLWIDQVPDWAASRWTGLKEASIQQGSWERLIEWYEARLRGGPTWPDLTPERNEELEVAIATLPDRLWEQGPATVNGEIGRLIDESHQAPPRHGDEAVLLLKNELASLGFQPSSALEEVFRKSGMLAVKRSVDNRKLTTSLPVFAAVQLGSTDRRDEDWPFLTAVASAVRAGNGYEALEAEYFSREPQPTAAAGEPQVRELSQNTRAVLKRACENRPRATPQGIVGVDAFFLALLETPDANALNNLGYMGVNHGALRKRLNTPQVLDGLWIPAPPVEPTDLAFLGDRPESENDYLGRADVAFILAAKLNQVWDVLGTKDIAGGPGGIGEGGFVVHVDAPWGGGKTTFANFLKLMLNPYAHRGPLPAWPAMKKLKDASGEHWPMRFRRPWHIVEFNAWQHQHVTPPWWCFYQAIRKQCFRAVLTEDGADSDPSLPPAVTPASKDGMDRLREFFRLWASELRWRFFTPKNSILLTVAVVVTGLAILMVSLGLLSFTDEGDLGANVAGNSAALGTVLAIVVGGGSFLWSIMSTVSQSLLPGTPSAAENYSAGAGDPLERFRMHFAGMIFRLRRPVLVIIDDLDRCEPSFVVELVRGMQTVLRSQRMIFLILGDRDWIEHAFAETHKGMQGIYVGPEHSFGARFVEKAIQLSLVLPDLNPDDRTGFVQTLLRVDSASAENAAKHDPTAADLLKKGEELAAAPDTFSREALHRNNLNHAENIADDATRGYVVKQLNREAALLNAVDERLQRATQHRLVPLAPVLPPNPRQIKRIINAVALFQEVARLEASIQPGEKDWQKLVQWVVLMTEYPQTWFTLNRYPGLADMLSNPNASPVRGLPESALAAHWLSLMQKDTTVQRLMAFDGWQAGQVSTIDTATVEKFRAILPATSGTLLPLPDKDDAAKPQKPPAPATKLPKSRKPSPARGRRKTTPLP